MLKRLKRWLQYWRFAISITRLAHLHESCCGAAAILALKAEPDWGSNRFSAALEMAYEQSGGCNCKLSGWQRRYVIYHWIARKLRMKLD